MQPSTSTESATRRQHYRLPTAIDVSVSSDNNFWTGFTENVSSGGVFIVTTVEVPIGTVLQFNLRLPPSDVEHLVTGEVRWLRSEEADSEHPPGLGVRFLGLEEPVRAAVEAFIAEQRGSLFFDDEE